MAIELTFGIVAFRSAKGDNALTFLHHAIPFLQFSPRVSTIEID
jgi:hypothetical protein